MRALALLLLVPFVVLAGDVKFRNAGTYIGPISELDCGADGGLLCTRDAGTSIGKLRCNAASSTEPGCMVPTAQTLSGNKTWTGYQRLTGVAHASLTACTSGLKNMMQGCTTHGALVWCDGTSNQELLGSVADEQVLASIYVGGIPTALWGGLTLPSTAGWTLNALTGTWQVGTGGGTLRLSFLGAAGTCNCDIDCDTPTSRTACTGTCAWSAGDTLLFVRGWSGSPCANDPHVSGNLQLMGVAQ